MYTTTVGELRDGLEVTIGDQERTALRKLTIYNRRGSRLAWRMNVYLSGKEILKLARDLRFAEQAIRKEEEAKEEAEK